MLHCQKHHTARLNFVTTVNDKLPINAPNDENATRDQINNDIKQTSASPYSSGQNCNNSMTAIDLKLVEF